MRITPEQCEAQLTASPKYLEFARMVANLRMDGEENANGVEFDMPNDHAVSTLHELISTARTLTADAPTPVSTELKPNLFVTGWRELGDDDDSIDLRMLSGAGSMPVNEGGVDHYAAIAREHDVAYDADGDVDDADVNAFLVTTEIAVLDGQEFTDETGRKWRVRFEAVA